MKCVVKKVLYCTVLFLNFAIIHSMDIDPQETTMPQLSMRKNTHKALEKCFLRRESFKRSCDEFYGNCMNDRHQYLEFSRSGKHLIELRTNNLARFVITEMATKKSKILPVCDAWWGAPITYNNKHLLIAPSKWGSGTHLFKINISKGKLIKDFSEKMRPVQPEYFKYKELAYNPRKENFISISMADTDEDSWLFCFHNSKTGKVKEQWREEKLFSGGIYYSPDGNYCVITHWKSIHMRNGKTGEKGWEIPIENAKITWHPQSSFLIAFSKGKHRILNVKDGKVEREFSNQDLNEYHTDHSFFNSNGNYYISMTEDYGRFPGEKIPITIRDCKTFEIIKTILVSGVHMEACSASFDGKYLVYFDTIKDGKDEDTTRLHYVVLYNLENNQEVARQQVENPVGYMRWRPHTNQFISVDRNSTELNIWNVGSGDLEKNFEK